MEGLLTPVSTSYADKREEAALVEVKEAQNTSKPSSKASTPAEALEILKNEPDYENLVSTLELLGQDSSDFSIAYPSPLAAQLIHVLVSDIIPNYWNLLYEGRKPNSKRKSKNASRVELLLSCLRNVTGLNALLLSIKQFIQQSKESKKTVAGPNIQDHLTILLQVLTELLHGDDIVEHISNTLWRYSTSLCSVRKALWNEFTSIVGSGKILGLAAEAEDVIGELSKKIPERHWIAKGNAYSGWLARNIIHWAKDVPENYEQGWKRCGDLFCKAFRLGHSGKSLNSKYGVTLTIL